MPFARPVLSPATGALRDEVEIIQEVETTSDTGDMEFIEEVVDTTRAKIGPLSGMEIFQAQQLGHTVSHRIQMRWNTNIDTAIKLRHFDNALQRYRDFEIVYALDVQNRHTQWDIFAHEILKRVAVE
jgi:SPP1 family predicted phage head-tail adaptor